MDFGIIGEQAAWLTKFYWMGRNALREWWPILICPSSNFWYDIPIDWIRIQSMSVQGSFAGIGFTLSYDYEILFSRRDIAAIYSGSRQWWIDDAFQRGCCSSASNQPGSTRSPACDGRECLWDHRPRYGWWQRPGLGVEQRGTSVKSVMTRTGQSVINLKTEWWFINFTTFNNTGRFGTFFAETCWTI